MCLNMFFIDAHFSDDTQKALMAPLRELLI